jgi:hypothetical protein
VLGRTTGNSNTHDSPRPGLGGSHHLPPYNILYASPWGPHPNGLLSWDSQVGVSKFPQLGPSQLWRCITWRADLRLWWILSKVLTLVKSFSAVCHTPPTRKEIGSIPDFQWLGVKLPIWFLAFSFGHNLCFGCPNGQCEPILNIYASIVFQWYKELFKTMSFDLWNCVLKVQESIWDSNSQHGSSFRSVRVHALILFGTPRSMWCDFRVFILGCNLATPYLGRKPKARVRT